MTKLQPSKLVDEIDSRIEDVLYVRVPESTTTIAAVRLDNGHVEVALSSCMDETKFDEETGRNMALAKAYEKLTEKFAFLIRENDRDLN